MITKNRYRTLIWMIIILSVTNISMGFSFLYHKKGEKSTVEQQSINQADETLLQRTRFFREQLNLQAEQVNSFREMNRQYNHTAQKITNHLEVLRVELIQELGREKVDSIRIEIIAEKIGSLHTELKKETADYYLMMKNVCDEDQKIRLNKLFLSITHQDKINTLHQQRGRQYRGHRQNRFLELDSSNSN